MSITTATSAPAHTKPHTSSPTAIIHTSSPTPLSESLLLSRIVARLDTLLARHAASFPSCPPLPDHFCKFYSKNPCAFPLAEYLKRFADHTAISRTAFVVALIYVERLAEAGVEGREEAGVEGSGLGFLALNRFNAHRVVMSALFLAHKFLDDETHSARRWAMVGGAKSPTEVCGLEQQMLREMGFRLNVSAEEFEEYQMEFVGYVEA
eukprot:CAMPEP_0174894036 /NCGR_PEP_ID=MMETSP0167-20121228/8736_1 /TAXON_ID=38298 /ORGANISM="Rhodella maculata, Strain CCMP736" /LENGTH=207 /DNA_ID=CAMNT_0016133005 /DNA_START=135 /DNA_END=758 /DNA_ORIENTATION=-